MPRPCSICEHPERDAIERAVVLSRRYRDIAGLYEISDSALSRHVNDHVLPYLARIREEEGMGRAASLVARLDELTSETRAIMRDARKEGGSSDDRALRAIRRLERQLELEAKILEVIKTAPQITVLIHPEVRQVIIDALRPFPEAGYAVADALGALEVEEAS